MKLTVEKCISTEELNYVSELAGLDENFDEIDINLGRMFIGKLNNIPCAYFIFLPYKDDIYDCHIAKSQGLSFKNFLILARKTLHIISRENKNLMGIIKSDHRGAKVFSSLMGFHQSGIMGTYTVFWRDSDG